MAIFFAYWSFFCGGSDVSCDCVGGEHEIEEAED
jgi:hypothetical protein